MCLCLRGVAVLTTAAIALSMAACGGKDAKGESAPPKTELTWWDTADPSTEGPAFKALIAKFSKNYPNIKIKHQWVPPDEARHRFKTAATAKSGAPDLLRSEVAWVADFAASGYLYNLDGSGLLSDASDYFDTPLSSAKYNGKTYGVPQVTDSLALLYNKKIFSDTGVTAPRTWAEVKTAAAAIKAKTGKDGLFIHSGGYFLLPFIYGEGGDLVDTTNQKIIVNSEANIAGIAIAQDLVRSGAAVKPPANDSYRTMLTLFTRQKVAMIISGPWELGSIRNASTFGGAENLGISPVPAGSVRAGAPVGGYDYVLYSGMPQQKLAAATAFVTFMNSAESQAFLAAELGLLPTRRSAYSLSAVRNSPTIAAFQPVIASAIARPWILESGRVFGPLDVVATEVLVEGKDPKAALDRVASIYKAEVVPAYNVG